MKLYRTTVAGTDARKSFNCSGATAYPLGAGFQFFNDTDLVVVRIDTAEVETVLTLNADYTVAGGDGETGTVTTVATYSDGRLVVYRETALVQSYDAQEGDGFSTDTFEQALDRTTMALQEISTKVGLALRYPLTIADTVDTELPTPEAGKALRWNATGDGLENTDVDLANVQLIADDAAASAASAASDAAQTALDAIATAADRVQTGLDVIAVASAYDFVGFNIRATKVLSYIELPNSLANAKIAADMSGDGTKLFIAEYATGLILEYALSTAWDLSTAVYSTSHDLTADGIYITDFAFFVDGTSMFISRGNGVNTIKKYTMSTPYDITTAVMSSSVSSTTGEPLAVDIYRTTSSYCDALVNNGGVLVRELFNFATPARSADSAFTSTATPDKYIALACRRSHPSAKETLVLKASTNTLYRHSYQGAATLAELIEGDSFSLLNGYTLFYGTGLCCFRFINGGKFAICMLPTDLNPRVQPVFIVSTNVVMSRTA